MSFGGQSNTPWQRNVMQGHSQSGAFHQGSQMFMQNAQQNNMAAFGHSGLQSSSSGNMFPGGGGGGNSVSYPQPRGGLNPVAFQQGGGGPSHYNSIGTVTKISSDCGLVNDEVFFYRNVCKGPEPKLGDRVVFEATYSNNGQFKWNATRVQLMQQHQQPQPLMSAGKGNYSSVAPSNEYQRSQVRRNSPKRSPVRGRHERDRRERDREHLHRSRERDENEHDRKRRREDHDRSRDRVSSVNRNVDTTEGRGHGPRIERERDRGESRKIERDLTGRGKERERTRDREIHRTGPKGRRARTIRRYMVQIPKALLSLKSANVQDLRQRYTTLYIPSDFFHSNIKWSNTFTPDNPFSLRRPCQFHIMHKVVDCPIEQNNDLLEPSDSNYLYSAKVMLMALPPIADIYKKCFESDDDDIDHHAVHPSRLINFLVGVRGRNEPMAIGGPWSPSLDGENPDKDPSVLIRTAIRTCKALTGIDLSNCTQWYRFVELYYHRTEYKSMEKDGPPRVETVVIYLPDVHSCMPSIEEWQTLTQVYKNAADDVIARRKALVTATTANANDDIENDNDNDKTNDAGNSTLAGDEEGPEETLAEKDISNAETVVNIDGDGNYEVEHRDDEKMDHSTTSISDEVAGVSVIVDDGSKSNEHKDDTLAEAADENNEPAPEPTHYTLLDLKSMKVQEIRDELLARNLSEKGVRNVVMARLAKALNVEKAEETKNKAKNKSQQQSSPKTASSKIESSNKRKKDDKQTNIDYDTDFKDMDNSEKSKDDKSIVSKGNNDKEQEQDDWADVIDFELSDIVILDEYDSSKNPEENALKDMDEKEKSQLIRRYTLPSNPHIIVHPNKIAKGGKFDCAVMSLSVLLDYHPDDTKERFFEVSLFAEIFNEMLMRDFGFNIYKEIYLYEDKDKFLEKASNSGEGIEVKAEPIETADDVKIETKEKDIKKETREKEDEKEKTSKKEAKSSSDASGTEKCTKEQHNDETQSIKSESRKRKISTSASTVNGKDRESSTSEKKMVVVKPHLLLSFVYFDTTHCGYIFEKDLEDLFTVLGLNLSRSQIKKVLGKLATRQAIYYRKLTDKEETSEFTPCIEDVDDLSTEELQRIAAGNNHYEAVFDKNNTSNKVSVIEEESEEGLINYNGTVVHVGRLVNQIKRTEKSFSDLEKLYNDLLKQHSDLQKENKQFSTKIKDLQSEIKNVSHKLTDANQSLYSLNRKYRDQNATLSYIYTRISPYFVREKDKDKESSRDKGKDEKEKEKDKDKEKDPEKTKDDKEKEKEVKKDGKEKEKLKDDKEKEKAKDDKEKEKDKEKSKDDKENEKLKDEKAKQITKDNKEKSTKDKESVLATIKDDGKLKKVPESKPAAKISKKPDTVSAAT